MADDEPYDLMPHRQISELKKDLQELKSNLDRASPKELINSMSTLTKSIDSMLKLFSQAADELKFEEKEQSLSGGKGSVNDKLDEIMDQNKAIADGMVAISDMIQDLAGKQKTAPGPSYKSPSRQVPNFQQPQQQFNNMMPQFDQQPMPQFDEPMPQFDQPPMPQQQGPVAMPSIPFSDFDEPKPKKKGLFGRLKI